MTTKLLDLDSERRNAILNAALREFSSQGFDNASTNVIAKEAGMSKALMFHYAGSKQELFLDVYDYFSAVMKHEYFELMNYNEKDVFNRLRQSYLLQIKLFEKYPWISEFSKLTQVTNSREVNTALENRAQDQQEDCYPKLFDKVDNSKFRNGLDIEKCKQIIFWSNVGFTNQVLDDIRNSPIGTYNSDTILKKADEFLDELKKIFYQSQSK